MSKMKDIKDPMLPALNAQELGHALRAERKARGLSQAALAQTIGRKRQTIVALEAGRNVSLYTLFAALAALGKGLLIQDARLDPARLQELFPDDEDQGT
ncbi:Transcriptional regulator, XRE family [Thiomonas sp. X19]|uniref:helix-turn-helix transcriptional regulator n=1 Tax=Thiomonas sp. X19 TaxID=1050370 RepID=UPI000B62F502|nr:helix-turn-helix transcriptional regulator [Thiomonas sp. X19]SCC91916.1 Transcriptional regulator, XRE family [Thiomonas sp. X19]